MGELLYILTFYFNIFVSKYKIEYQKKNKIKKPTLIFPYFGSIRKGQTNIFFMTYCISLLQLTTTSKFVVTNMFEIEHISAVKFNTGYEKKYAFLLFFFIPVITRSWKVGNNNNNNKKKWKKSDQSPFNNDNLHAKNHHSENMCLWHIRIGKSIKHTHIAKQYKMLKGAQSYFSKYCFLLLLKNHHSSDVNVKFSLKRSSPLDERSNLMHCSCLYLTG